MALTQISTQGIKDGTITGTDLATNIDLVDNQKLRLGNSQDLQIYHDGTNSNIDNATNELRIESINQIRLNTNDFRVYKGNLTELTFRAVGDGSNYLYYDGSLKFETTSSGVNVTDSDGSVNIKLTNNSGTAAFVYADGTNTGFLDSQAHFLVKGIKDGAVELYYDNTLRFLTNSIGAQCQGDFSIPLDNEELRIGAGNDLRAYHNGANSVISNATGEFRIVGDDVRLMKADQSEHYFVGFANSYSAMYFDNSKKFETTSGGAKVTGFLNVTTGIHIPDGGNNDSSITIGSDNDLRLFHDGSNSKIVESGTGGLIVQTNNFNVDNAGGTKNILTGIDGGAVELYHDGSLKFETKSFGGEITGNLDVTGNLVIPNNTGKFLSGASNNLEVYHNGTNAQFDNKTGNLEIRNKGTFSGTRNIFIRAKVDESSITCKSDGAVELYHDNSKKFNTLADGVHVHGQIQLNDNGKLNIGDSDDLQIFHNGSDSKIVNSTGSLDINGSGNINIGKAGENGVKVKPDNAVELYYDNSKKLSTINEGVEIKGSLYPETDNLRDLGSSSKRWRDIYTNDLNLSNEGGANDVDGTWGSYTIQEGAEDLFLVNKRNGKKYKFNLTEVS